MMIQHRSGIPNFTDNPAYWENEEENGKNALNFALDLPANFKPNEGYEYSNTNYLLLRRIMDEALGYNHHEYIKEKSQNFIQEKAEEGENLGCQITPRPDQIESTSNTPSNRDNKKRTRSQAGANQVPVPEFKEPVPPKLQKLEKEQ